MTASVDLRQAHWRPPWMADFPPMFNSGPYRQLPNPATAGRYVSTAGLLGASTGGALGLRRRCSMCGCAMPLGRPVFHVFNSSPGDVGGWSERPGGVLAVNHPGPMHKSCAFYATLVCPFLKYGKSQRRYDRGRPSRGGGAAIVGFDHFGIIFDVQPKPQAYNEDWEWALGGEVERIGYRSWEDVLPLYEGVVAAEVIDTSTRLYWRLDDLNDCQWLKGNLVRDDQKLRGLRKSAAPLGDDWLLAVL
jgi:hypothetical protein